MNSARNTKQVAKLISFTPTESVDCGTRGVAVFEFAGKQKDLPALEQERYITVYGLAIKYRTGTKIWNAQATVWKDNGNIQFRGGLDNRQRAGACIVLGFYSDYADKSKSQHGGN